MNVELPTEHYVMHLPLSTKVLRNIDAEMAATTQRSSRGPTPPDRLVREAGFLARSPLQATTTTTATTPNPRAPRPAAEAAAAVGRASSPAGGGGGGREAGPPREEVPRAQQQWLTHKLLHRPVQPTTSEGIYCMWDLHPFSTRPVALPIAYSEATGLYTTTGLFCSLACAAAYNHADHRINASLRADRHALLGMLYRETQPGRGPLRVAPARECLRIFGGSLCVEEFREQTAEETYILPPPLRPYAVYQIHGKSRDTRDRNHIPWTDILLNAPSIRDGDGPVTSPPPPSDDDSNEPPVYHNAPASGPERRRGLGLYIKLADERERASARTNK